MPNLIEKQKKIQAKNDYLWEVHVIDGQLALTVKAFAFFLHYSEEYINQLIKQKKLKAFTWRHISYIFIPRLPVTKLPKNERIAVIKLPTTQKLTIDWVQYTGDYKAPPPVQTLRDFQINTSQDLQTGKERILNASIGQTVLPLVPKPRPLLRAYSYPSILEWQIGKFIIYSGHKPMSIFVNGGGTLHSTHKPSALLEAAILLDAAENARNGANPGLPPKRNIVTQISFDTGTVSIAATLPITQSLVGGTPKITITDYLGTTYSTYSPGTAGDTASTTIMGAFVEVAASLSNAEKLVTPIGDQPNNVQVIYDMESEVATITAALPFTYSIATNGDPTVTAVDYL